MRTPVHAIPDLVDNQVEIYKLRVAFARNENLSAFPFATRVNDEESNEEKLEKQSKTMEIEELAKHCHFFVRALGSDERLECPFQKRN